MAIDRARDPGLWSASFADNRPLSPPIDTRLLWPMMRPPQTVILPARLLVSPAPRWRTWRLRLSGDSRWPGCSGAHWRLKLRGLTYQEGAMADHAFDQAAQKPSPGG